ncbi:FKBP12-interacting protein [Glycine max]|nr:FKBP12-interacting protein [Glycine max]
MGAPPIMLGVPSNIPINHWIFQNELKAAKSEIQKWHSSFQNEPFISAETTPPPKLVINYLQALKSSEESLRGQVQDLVFHFSIFLLQNNSIYVDHI